MKTLKKPSGLRRFTAADARALEAIKAYDADNSPRRKRYEILCAFKRAGQPLGLDCRTIDAIDQLAAFTKRQDWQGGPITVWPSNERLMRVFRLGKSSVQKLLTRLKEAGLIAFIDSPSGARYGRRDDDGRIVEAYGIDLRPLAARYDEFVCLADRDDEDAVRRNALRRRRTILSKAVRQIADSALEMGLPAPFWKTLVGEAAVIVDDTLKERCPDRLAVVIDRLQQLHGRAMEAFGESTKSLAAVGKSMETVKILPSGRTYSTPITTITKPQSLKKRQVTALEKERSRCDARYKTAVQERGEADNGVKRDDGDKNSAENRKTDSNRAVSVVHKDVARHFERYKISPSLVQSASTGLCKHVWDDDPPDWTDIIEGAYRLLKPLGISQHAWGQACLTLSRQGAAVAVAVIAEKHRRGQEGGGDKVIIAGRLSALDDPHGQTRWH